MQVSIENLIPQVSLNMAFFSSESLWNMLFGKLISKLRFIVLEGHICMFCALCFVISCAAYIVKSFSVLCHLPFSRIQTSSHSVHTYIWSCHQCCVVLPMLCTTFWVISTRLWRYLMTLCRSRHLTTTTTFCCWSTALQLGAVVGGSASAPSGVRPRPARPGGAVAMPPTTRLRMSAWCWSYSDRLASDGQLFSCLLTFYNWFVNLFRLCRVQQHPW